MGSGIKLSHSKTNKYLECPVRYENYYEKKIRSRVYGSPLFFGSAIDNALNRLLLDKKPILNEEEKEEMKFTPLEILTRDLKTGSINRGEEVELATYPYLQFSKADFDKDVLLDEDFEFLGEDKVYWVTFVEWYHAELRKSKPEIEIEDTMKFNKVNLRCLLRKGEMILEVYQDEIMPQIKEVISVQKVISLPNDKGDEVTGVIDFEAIFVGDPEIYIVDNKTASKAYKDSDLVESSQLHTYAEAEGRTHIAFIVCEKNIRKRDPRVRINVLKGKINDETMTKTFDKYKNTLVAIREGNFEQDRSSNCRFFGRRCEYYDLCHHEQMGKDLIDYKEK
jgi:hypothetical protein